MPVPCDNLLIAEIGHADKLAVGLYPPDNRAWLLLIGNLRNAALCHLVGQDGQIGRLVTVGVKQIGKLADFALLALYKNNHVIDTDGRMTCRSPRSFPHNPHICRGQRICRG